MTHDPTQNKTSLVDRTIVWMSAIGVALFGAVLLAGGVVLAFEGGSLYYVLAGAATLVAGVELARRRPTSVVIFSAVLVVTLSWSLWEVGLDGWPLVPRLTAFAVIGLFFMTPAVHRATRAMSRWWVGAPVVAIVSVLIGVTVVAERAAEDLQPASKVTPADGQAEWRHYGHTLSGARYSPLTQIDTSNAQRLELAWEFKSDVPAFGAHSYQMTPLAVGNRVFLCADRNVVLALDQDTGREVWRFDPQTQLDGLYGATCRGVSYFEAPHAVAECSKRILFGTADGRLMAVDAESGRACTSFGVNGAVDLRVGMGTLAPGDAIPTSPPTLVNGIAVIGQYISDFLSTDAPSGVVRGYDALSGDLRWAWDAGRPDRFGVPPAGETYTRNTPNAWTVFSGDEALGLVYVPTGNSTPDNIGSRRAPESQKFSSSVVAIEAATGKLRWSFQTVHHDVWDYDVASQPVVAELPGPQGQSTPALIVPTKRGALFVLDRRDGKPIDPVIERPVPQGSDREDRTAKTQPFPIGFPSVAGPELSEASMWGVTPVDQLWCRIRFKQARYEGLFTPPSTRATIAYPGAAGGSNWGSVALDTDRNLLVVNTLHVADIGVLMPLAEMRALRLSHYERTLLFPQDGFPYAFKRTAFMSPLAVPCQQPPYGRLSVFDARTRKLVWSQSFGTAERSGPWGLQSFLPIRIGVPNMGGAIATAGGVVFIAAAQDRYFRAIDIGNGNELWRASLPAVGAATPMTYMSERSGRQYVVIAAGGHPGIPGPSGSSLMAFALPR